MNAILQTGVIASISIAAATATLWIKGPPDRSVACDPELLAADELCIDQVPADADIVWVDARTRAEWETSGLPGSILWNLDPTEDMQAFEADAAMRIAVNPRVIVYCADENCGISRQIAERIRGLGFGAEVSVLHGGWRALLEAGRIPPQE